MSGPLDLSPELVVGYRQRGLIRADELADLLDALKQNDDRADEVIADIRRIVHMVKGSGGSYGFPQLTSASMAFESRSNDEIADATHAFIDLLRRTLLNEAM